MNFQELSIAGAFNIDCQPFRDNRGYFHAPFRSSDNLPFLQNFSAQNVYLSHNTHVYTLRGFHRQTPPFQEQKIMSCLSGSVFHVLARFHPEKGWSVATNILTDTSFNSSFVPADCYSAFLTLSPNSLVQYVTDAPFSPHHQDGICWSSASLQPFVTWPHKPCLVSDRDASLPNV